MITVQLTPADIARVRFAYSPLIELVMSYRALRLPTTGTINLRWRDEAERALQHLEFPHLHALASNPFYIPDFLSPTPTAIITNLEAELTAMRQTPLEIIRANIYTAFDYGSNHPLLQYYLAHPYEALNSLIEELRLYWKQTLAHHWPQMMAALDGDILYRARLMALEGSTPLFSGLYEDGQYHALRLSFQALHKPLPMHHDYALSGQGIQLVPNIFVSSLTLQIEPDWHPMIVYRSRGTGLWWSSNQPVPDQSLEIAIGNGRAHVLRLLAIPSSTGEIAHQLQMTAGAVSQHLARLNKAGLVEPHRSGKRVYYHLTRRGEDLLRLFN